MCTLNLRHLALVALLSLVTSLASVTGAAAPAPGSPELDAVEDVTESLANALLDMGVVAQGRDAAKLAPVLEDRVTLRLPDKLGAATQAWRMVVRQPFDLSTPAVDVSRDQAVAALQRLLGHFDSIEDVRFALTAADPVGGDLSVLKARFEAAIVGRDATGRRAWLRGTGALVARSNGGAWRLAQLVFDEASTLTASRDLFTDVSVTAGVARQDPTFAERGYTGLVSHGAAIADVDNDGRMDVFATGLRANVLFRNKGDGTFEDVAEAAHVAASSGPGDGPLFLDYDGDGDEDVFVSAVGRQMLFENRLIPDGQLAFRDVSTHAGVDVESAGFSACAGDVNGDGRPDVYVACYNRYGQVAPDSWDHATNGLPNLLFLNKGDGTFREAAKELGVADARWSYASELVDIDDDGDLDLYVTNDFGGPDALYLNEVKQTGRFRDVTAERGLAVPSYGMGVSFADIDLDGDLDLMVTRMSSIAGNRVLDRVPNVPEAAALRSLASGNALYENVGGAKFRDITALAGFFRAGWSWGAAFFDADGDGRPDVLAPSGFLSGTSLHDTQSLFWRQVVASKTDAMKSTPAYFQKQVAAFGKGLSFSGHERDVFCLNHGGGRFLDVSGASGLDSVTDGRAVALADFDDDGDLDVFLRAMHSSSHVLYRNDVSPGAKWFRVALEGRASGRDAFGAIVRAKVPEGILTRVKDGGSGFMAQSDPRMLFGLNTATKADSLEVSWPSGLKQKFAGPKAGESWLIVEGEAEPRVVSEKAFELLGPRARVKTPAPVRPTSKRGSRPVPWHAPPAAVQP